MRPGRKDSEIEIAHYFSRDRLRAWERYEVGLMKQYVLVVLKFSRTINARVLKTAHLGRRLSSALNVVAEEIT